MTLAHFIVIKVVSRGDLYTTSTKLHVNIIISNNGYFSISEWQINGFTNQVCIALIIWMYGNCTITEHGFRARSGNHHHLISTGNRVAHMPQRTLLFCTDNLKIRNRCVQYRIPVNQSLTTID